MKKTSPVITTEDAHVRLYEYLSTLYCLGANIRKAGEVRKLLPVLFWFFNDFSVYLYRPVADISNFMLIKNFIAYGSEKDDGGLYP